MRVLVRSRKTDGRGSGNDSIEVVNADTGEQIQGIVRLTFCADAGHRNNKLTLEIADCDVDITEEAEVVDWDESVVFVPTDDHPTSAPTRSRCDGDTTCCCRSDN